MYKLLLVFALYFLSLVAGAAALPEASFVPGGMAIIPLTESDKSTKAPVAWYRGNRVMVLPAVETVWATKSKWIALVGIPLSASANKPQHLKADGVSYNFDIQAKTYSAQYLTIKNKRHVDPNPEDVKRWRREKAKMQAAFKHWSEPQQAVVHFDLPTKGPFSSQFGLRRFLNKKPRSPHSGLDIAAPSGAVITAPAAGTVIDTGNYFFNGNTVILDHGFGLTSMYCHMSRIDVKIGQVLASGDPLGLVGKTGRVTGAHLHWGVSLNNTRIDPMIFLDKTEQTP